MTDQSLPKPNTQALSWFFGEHKKGTLDLKPRYQRYAIWSPGQKCFLIDSLISGAPIPQVFLNIKTGGSGRERRTIYEVVDGQQRLRAILEYMDDEYPPIATTARSAYPYPTRTNRISARNTASFRRGSRMAFGTTLWLCRNCADGLRIRFARSSGD